MIEKSERRAWRVASISWVLLVLLTIAVGIMLPLKEKVPYLYREDKLTGEVELVTTLKEGTVTYNDTRDKYWLAKYARARENYDWYTVAQDYETVGIMSARDVAKDYARLFDGEDRLIRSTARCHCRSKNKLGRAARQRDRSVRFSKTIKRRGASDTPIKVSKWIATLGYEYRSVAKMKEKDRLINPFAFVCTSWRVDPEINEIAPAGPAPAPAQAGQGSFNQLLLLPLCLPLSLRHPDEGGRMKSCYLPHASSCLHWQQLPTLSIFRWGSTKVNERVTRAVYKDNEVYRINAYPGIGVHIIFAADEEVIDFGSGFSKAWEFKVGRGKNTFYLKPKMEGSDTNLFIQTNKHAYSFELVLFRDWKKSQKDRRKFPYDPQMVFRIEFTYPEDEAARTAKYLEDKKRQSRLDAIPAPYVRNSKYTMQVGENSREIVPTLAFDDGRFT